MKLKEYLEMRGYSQKKLAEVSGITRMTLNRIDRGILVSKRVAEKIKRIVGEDVEIPFKKKKGKS